MNEIVLRMSWQHSYESAENRVEVIRDELRYAANIGRKQHRTAEWNKRRAALGDITIKEESWDLTMVIAKSQELKKKTLSIDDYLRLQTSLIQDEENIRGFLSINNTISALIRDVSSANPAIKLAAAHCCCNIALANSRRCSTLYKYAGPYLVGQLETLDNPLLEISAWTIGNLCSGSKNAFKSLHAQGCISRLVLLLRKCDITILPSIIYAITQCLHGGSDLMSESETVEITKILVERSCFETVAGLWILALLSSRISCREMILPILARIFDELVMKINDECPDTSYITAAIRLFANSVTESKTAAEIILANPIYSIEDIHHIFDVLLAYPHIHVRRETLWLIGNLYSNSNPNIVQTLLIILPTLQNLKYSVQSNKTI